MKTQPKKILIVTPYFPPEGGGAERYALEIAFGLKSTHAWKIYFLSTAPQGGRDETKKIQGMIVYRLGYSAKISNTPFSVSWLTKIPKILKAIQPDSIIIHTPVPGLGNIVAAYAHKTPVIVIYHAGSMRKGKFIPDLFVNLYEQTFLQLLLRRANSIICSSDSVRQTFLRTYIKKSITITPGADSNMFIPDPGRKNRHPTMIFVGGLGKSEQFKGLRSLIDVTRELKKKIPDIRLLVVGDGDMRREYENQVNRLGLQKSVMFKGRLGGTDLVHAYQEAHVLVSPSTNDSFGMAILEGMSSGLPAVAFNVGDVPILIEHNKTGFVIEKGNVNSLSEKTHLILTNRSLALQFGQAGRTKAKRNYNWKTKTDQFSQVLLQATVKKPVHIIHAVAYYPPHIGGMEQRVKELATFEADKGLDVSVFTSDIGYHKGTYLQDNVKVSYFSCLEIAHTPIPLSLFGSLIRRKHIDMIHLHVAQAFFPEIVALVARLRSIPYVAHVRCLIIPSGIVGKLFLPFYNRQILARVYRGAKKVIVLTPGYINIMNKEYGVPKGQITVIPNATTFHSVKSPRVTIHNPPRLLAVGRVSVQKNYSFMINVMKHLKDMYNLHFTLTVVGPGDGIEELREQTKRLGLTDSVRFVGGMDRVRVEKLYLESDLLIHTSLIESFGTIFIEAMAKGLPIVASRVLGTDNVVQHERNGLKMPLTIRDMSHGIMKILRDKQLYQQISANNLTDIGMYKWNNVLKQTLDVYGYAAH